MTPFLQGKRVWLGKVSTEDNFTNYLSFINDVDNLIWLDGVGNFPLNKGDVIEYIDDNDRLLLGILNAEGEHVGNIQLSEISFQHRNAMLGVIIGKEFRGKGYASSACELLIKHAFEILNLHRIYLTVISGNSNAIKLYEKLGFQEEGRERDMHLVKGSYYDGIRYSLLSSQYGKERR